MTLPPVLTGATKLTDAWAFPGLAVPMVGAPGMAAPAVGVTLFDAADDKPVPITFFAVTVKIYAVPLARPVTVSGEDVPLAVSPPGLEVTV